MIVNSKQLRWLVARRYAAFLARLWMLLLALPGMGASVSLNPSADAFVTTGPAGTLSDTNYGGAGALAVSAAGLAKGEFRSVLRFDLSTARNAFDAQFGAGQWSLQSVILQLTAASPNNPIFNPSAAGQFAISWMQNDGWVEGTGGPNAPTATGITFSSLQGTFMGAGDEGLGIFNNSGATTGITSYILGLPSGFAADVMTGNEVSLRLFAADSAVSFLADARNFPTVTSRPVLTIFAVPEPGTALLALLGIGAWMAVTRARGRSGKGKAWSRATRRLPRA